MRRPPLMTTIALGAVIAVIFLLWAADRLFSKPNPNIQYGLTFSTYYAKHLGLDPVDLYRKITGDLKVKKIRLPVYWDNVEPEPDRFDFSEVDQLLKITPQDVQITLAIGYKVPRWPESFAPSWAEKLDQAEKQARVLIMLRRTVEYFKDTPQITAWQVENEPELGFGPNPLMPAIFLKTEIDLVRSLDSRPVVTTDSGELTLWKGPLKYADTMGISLYREVWNKYIGYIRYPFPPMFYQLKAALLPKLWSGKTKEVIVSELQAEPWLKDGSPLNVPISEQLNRFSPDDFRETISFAQKVGFKEQYLWGVEWWYWMKENNRPEYWEYAGTLFR